MPEMTAFFHSKLLPRTYSGEKCGLVRDAVSVIRARGAQQLIPVALATPDELAAAIEEFVAIDFEGTTAS